jgi:TldD protein
VSSTVSSTIDPTFLDLPLQRLADAALTRARELGAEHAELRCDQTRQAEWRLRDGAHLRSRDRSDRGLGVRVLVDGAWGFAGGKDVDPTSAARVASLAVDVARACRPLYGERVEVVDEPVYPGARWISPYECNPFDVPETELVGQLAAWSERLLAHRAVDHVDAKLRTTQETKFYADPGVGR